MLKTYEEYFDKMEFDEDSGYENGFCPFTRKPCMGADCQTGLFKDGIFYGCAMIPGKWATCFVSEGAEGDVEWLLNSSC